MIFPRPLLLFLAVALAAPAAPVQFKARCLADLVAEIPGLLASQNRANGQFGQGIWIVTDQNVLLPLAIAWSYADPQNPFSQSPEVLAAIVRGGDALIAAQDANGRWIFRKKDNSTWGQIYMPWTYSRWIRAYQIVRDAMPAEARGRWERALELGYTGIAREVAATKIIANIPTHHAMGLHFAGEVFQRPEWRQLAHDFIHRVSAEQHADGYWSEHSGPVIAYGFVYVEALGIYAAAAHDEALRETLRRSALFHGHFTYPDGTPVETIDERNPYHGDVVRGTLGFTLTPEGRTYFAHQLARSKARLPADTAATLLRWGEEGEGAVGNDTTQDFDFRLSHGDAAVCRRGPWFIVVSAFTAPISTKRWIQDRQNFISIYHERAGLILGGGNTKLQPGWSNFTAGDITRFQYRPGDESPRFTPPADVVHVPSAAKLIEGDDLGLELTYGDRRAQIRLHVVGPEAIDYVVSGDAGLTAHLTLMPRLPSPLRGPSGTAELRKDNVAWTAAAGSWIEHGKARLTVPISATVAWPVLPHNPYRKDGHAERSEGRIVVTTPVSARPQVFRLDVQP